MLPNLNPVAQATLSTLFTWGLTALGAGMVVIFHSTQRKLLDTSLGFAGGVMIAASYWSLLAPAIDLAEDSKMYGEKGEYAFIPVSIGFFVGALFVYLTDVFISNCGLCTPQLMLAMENDVKCQVKKTDAQSDYNQTDLHLEGYGLHQVTSYDRKEFYENNPSRRRTNTGETPLTPLQNEVPLSTPPETQPFTVFSNSEPKNLNYFTTNNTEVPRTNNSFAKYTPVNKNYINNMQSVLERRGERHSLYDCSDINVVGDSDRRNSEITNCPSDESKETDSNQWKRIVLLIIAITVHNIPEGLAVGVAFGAIGSVSSATFENARNLAIGIGIQNFPEGLAVSLPLRASGFSVWRSFWYGQLSGMVEPVFGILGAIAVSLAKPILPYALSFAAGAMIYVVVDDIIPEANNSGNGKLATWGSIFGFLVMMMLDVGLG